MVIIDDDILTVSRGIICHQVNCKRVMGAGLAAAIRKKYPRHYEDYMKTDAHLGELVVTQANDDLYIVGIYGQHGYGRDKRYTDYGALEKGLTTVDALSRSLGLPVYLPYGIGCGLAGGDWEIVKTIIDKVLPNAIAIKKS